MIPGAMHSVTGQLTFRRAVSKRLVFYDMLVCGTGGRQEGEEPESELKSWVEVVVKLGIYGSVDDVKDLRDRLKLGDIVRVQGSFSCSPATTAGTAGTAGAAGASHELQATGVTVLRAWRDSRPGEAFRPQPSPLHVSTQQAQQQQQQQQAQQQPACIGSIGQQQQEQAQQQQQAQQQPACIGSIGQQQQEQAQQQPACIGSIEQQQSGDVCQAAATGALEGAAATMPSAAAPATELATQPAQPQPAAVGLCKYFVNTGRCAKGSACPFAHGNTGAQRESWLADMRSERQVLSSWQGFAHSGGAAAKSRRAQVLAAWLVEMYGRDALNGGEGVLDVAGGAGGVTFELRHVHGIRSTLVDPRPLLLSKQQRRQLAAAGRAASIHTLTTAQLQAHAHPQHVAAAAAGGLPGQDADSTGGASGSHDAAAAGTGDAADCEGAAGGAALALHQVQAWFGPELWRSAAWRQRFPRGFSLVLACHPDQATDPALDYALEARLPFAIVPCCVFPRLFPHRRLPRPSTGTGDGGGGGSCGGSGTGSGGSSGGGAAPVLTYGDLLEYLAAKGQAQQAVLGFQGANTVVYRQHGQHVHQQEQQYAGQDEQRGQHQEHPLM